MVRLRVLGEVLDTRRRQSEEGLRLVRDACTKRLPAIVGEYRLAIYVTGSFGRLEAIFPKGSDLDLFFLYDPEDGRADATLPNLQWFELAAEVIKIARDLKFEEFSRDGEYLKVHNVQYIGRELGSPHEDSENGFTARLLLLLESRHVLDEDLYLKLMKDTIGFYFEDYPANRDTFRPTFLINDILRFWRTLCLNYENKRGRKRREAESEEEHREWRADSALDNLKLRFSRLSTCFSMVAALAAQPTPVSPERVLELCLLAPTDRWGVAAHEQADAQGLVERLLERYEQFLEETAAKKDLLRRLHAHEERARTRQQANEYGEIIATLLRLVSHPEQARTLLI